MQNLPLKRYCTFVLSFIKSFNAKLNLFKNFNKEITVYQCL